LTKRCICIQTNYLAFHDVSMSIGDTTVVTTRINAALKAKLEALARSTKRSKSFLAAEAIAAYVELNEWQIGEIAGGIAELDSGEAFSEKQAEERYNRLLQPR
jgi:RHH-type rel operon transcriptional repressor/antitoxin RelB